MTKEAIPLYRPYLTGNELPAVAEVVRALQWAGNGRFSRQCEAALSGMTGKPVLLTPSGTAALDLVMTALAAAPGDEVIVPSYTFAATATSVVQAGLVPVFVDVRPDTLNLDETLIEAAIGSRTRAVAPVHYAGVAAEMDAILAVARSRRLVVLEDAAQGLNAAYRDRPLGGLGDLGILSFHNTKNVSCGEGGAVIIGNPEYRERVEVHHEVGTDRARFLRGEIAQYSWVGRGSNYLLSDVLAAFLLAQLGDVESITERRRRAFGRYVDGLRPLEERGVLRLPVIPPHCRSNYQSFHVLVDALPTRDRLQQHLKARAIGSSPHYVPLHMTAGGQRFGVARTPLKIAEMVGDCLLRLPFYTGLTEADQDRVIDAVCTFYRERRG